MTVAVRLARLLDTHDRGLLARMALDEGVGPRRRRGWIVVTHAGGAVVTISSVVVPLTTDLWSQAISARAAVSLTASHLLVQLLKRRVNRARPDTTAHIPCPDCFSFPSGHATAALAVALSYALAAPMLAVPLVGFALIVGWSRVKLGVHYPGDVIMGQLIAVATVAIVMGVM
jgi:undecaprenyl-diphosphatase